jgi:uncharacterized caspase-like protein
MTFAHGYALLIGVDQHGEEELALPPVEKDVQALQAVLTHAQRCGYMLENVHTLLGPQATLIGILEGLDWLKTRLAADPQATAVIYYSGHGWQDGDAHPPVYYLIPYDAQRARLRHTALRADNFAAEVNQMKPARLLVLLDCCHARGMDIKDAAVDFTPAAIPAGLFLGSEKGVRPEAMTKGLEALSQGRGRAVLSSCQQEQRSYLRLDGKMSIFTYHLIEALTGHAQPQEGAKEVLTSDIASHVMRRVPESARKMDQRQEPDVYISGVFPVALLLGGEGLGKGQTPPDPIRDAPPTAPVNYHAQASGSAVIVQGSGNTVVGAGGVMIGGNVTGDVVTGTKKGETKR